MPKKPTGIKIIDRPVSLASSKADIEKWIERLKSMPQLPEVLSELSFAKTLLKLVEKADD